RRGPRGARRLRRAPAGAGPRPARARAAAEHAAEEVTKATRRFVPERLDVKLDMGTAAGSVPGPPAPAHSAAKELREDVAHVDAGVAAPLRALCKRILAQLIILRALGGVGQHAVG